MPTTTSYSYCTVAAETSNPPYGGEPWDRGTITTSTTANASCSNRDSHPSTKSLRISIPTWAAAIEAGSEFVSMDIKVKAYATDATAGAGNRYDMEIVQDGTIKKSVDRYTTSTTEATYSGDASYWGLTGGSQAIITGIKNGSVKIAFVGVNFANNCTFHVKTFSIRITHTAPVVKWASPIAVIP